MLLEAERRARRELFEHDHNAAMLDSGERIDAMIRERGSRVTQKYEELPGRTSARYIEGTPSWFLEAESIERAMWRLIDAVTTAGAMLKFAQERRPELYGLYAAKYRDGLPRPELRKRFGAKLDKLDRELVFSLIYWHGWCIDEDGGAFLKWLKTRRGW